VADTVSIIGRGRLLAEGNVEDILEAGGSESARVGIGDPTRAATLLAEAGFAVSSLPDGTLKVSSGVGTGQGAADLDPAHITRVLADHGLYLFELTPARPDLESVFLELTADEHLGATLGEPR
jgi:ABC-type multidrug transport system ATPase subunit